MCGISGLVNWGDQRNSRPDDRVSKPTAALTILDFGRHVFQMARTSAWEVAALRLSTFLRWPNADV